LLVDLNITEFAERVASDKPTMPAGGCVTALTGLMGISLMEMSLKVSSLKPADQALELTDLQKTLQQIHQRMVSYIDKDAEAFNKVIAALKLQKNFNENDQAYDTDKKSAMLDAIEVPLTISKDCLLALECSRQIIKMIKPSVEGDLKVGILTTKASADGALLTAKINVSMLNNKDKVNELLTQVGVMQRKLDKIVSGIVL